MNEKYFDNAVATKPSTASLEAQADATAYWQCLSAPYLRAPALPHKLQEWYTTLKQFFGFRDSDRCLLTSSSNEAVSHIFSGIYKDTVLQMGKNQIVHLSIDEAPILLAADELSQFHVVQKSIDVQKTGGVLTKDLLREHLTPRTALVSISWAHGLTGVIHPMWELAELCEQEGILLHVDATEVVGKLYFHFQDLPVDYMTIDGARIYAPYGTGLLLSRRGSDMPPFIPDAMQQDGMRGGVFNTPGFAGITKAVEELGAHADHMGVEMIRLRDLFEKQVADALPEVVALFTENERLPHVSVLSFPGIHAAHLQHALAHQQIYTSRGGGIHQTLDGVLLACGVEPHLAHSALTFSFPRDITEEVLSEVVHDIAAIYTRLRKGGLIPHE